MVTTSAAASFSRPLGSDSRRARFLDLDGMLLDFSAKPDRVVVKLLPALRRTFDGAR